MAITQQLVRLSDHALSDCATDVRALARLLAFAPDIVHEHLDLGWAPEAIARAALRQAGDAAAELVRAATYGVAAVNAEFPAGPGDDPLFEGEVRFVPSPRVVELAEALSRIRPGPADQAELPRDIAEGLGALTAFYQRAAAAAEPVAMWWD